MKKVFLVFVGLVVVLGTVVGNSDLVREFNRLRYELRQFLERLDVEYRLTQSLDILHLKGKVLLEFGRFEEAKGVLSRCNLLECKKDLALAYYRLGDYTRAYAIWERLDLKRDWKYVYYYAKTCEALNLFPQAKRLLKSIPEGSRFYTYAQEDLKRIEQQSETSSLSDLFPKEVLKDIFRATVKRYPQAGSVIIREITKTEIMSDNRKVQRIYVLRKILNERGKKEHGEVVIRYDSTCETVRVIRARTITPDGHVVRVGKQHIRDVSLYKNFPMYSNLRAKIISMPSLVPGALIEYEVEIQENRLLAGNHILYYVWPQGWDPVLFQSDALIVPKDMKLYHKDVNLQYNDFKAVFNPKVQKVCNGEKVLMKWIFRDVPQVLPEPDMPSLINCVPIRIYSSFSSWDQIYQWWWDLAKDKMVADKAIRKKVRELIKDKKTDWEKAKAIYHYCASQIRYVAVEYGKAGYEPHPASEVFANKYGDCKDQAILLVTMLRSAGLKKAYPVIIPTREILDMDPDFPALMFNHAIAVVEIDGKRVFMDPTASTCGFGDLPPSDQGRGVLICTDHGLMLDRTPVWSPSHNQVKVITQLKPEGRGIKGMRTVIATGCFAMAGRYQFKYTIPESVRQSLEDKVKTILPDAKVQGYKVENLDALDKEVILQYKFSGHTEMFLRAGPYRIVPVFESISLSDVVKEKRRYPVEKLVPMVRESVYRFILPYPIEPIYLPKSIQVDNDWFSYQMEYAISDKDGKSVLEQRIRFVQKCMQISTTDYPKYKRAKEELSRKLRERGLVKIEKRKKE